MQGQSIMGSGLTGNYGYCEEGKQNSSAAPMFGQARNETQYNSITNMVDNPCT